MEKVIGVLKNWWVALLSAALVILDGGFDVINPVLEVLNVPVGYVDYVKAAFLLYGIYKLQNSLPTQDVDKLQEIVNNKKALLKTEKTDY